MYAEARLAVRPDEAVPGRGDPVAQPTLDVCRQLSPKSSPPRAPSRRAWRPGASDRPYRTGRAGSRPAYTWCRSRTTRIASMDHGPLRLSRWRPLPKLLNARPELTLDGQRPSREQLAARLAGFWSPDEVVVDIGLAGARASRPRQGEVARRVEEYYKTALGARTPHAGGWPLKTLVSLSGLFVHYAYCRDVEIAEAACIRHFADHVSDATRKRLYDPVRVMPFANLEFPKGNSKNHGIRGARALPPRPARNRNPVEAGSGSPTRLITTGDAGNVCGRPAPPVPEGHVERHRGRSGPHPHRAN